ncbi:unnamed protein product [Notodromas monacha]|uniref:UDP-galactopyranose mutase C-terminal domain-containing protein n=1 Tax=Notodromas monacha TaxID=399045 RepID=A0A7R9GCE8_9CRUS|nr:unnamed protein product [Notodromas monacha]CAG0917586.1 unnamed protein product [Notodromas monacha]
MPMIPFSRLANAAGFAVAIFGFWNIFRLMRNPRETRVLVVGAGLSGSIMAERLTSTCKNVRVTIVEKRDHIGGNCHDYIDAKTGIRVHQYGVHIFHTVDDAVWRYLSQFTDWVPYEHRALAKLETGKFVSVPVNIHTVNDLYKLGIKSEGAMKKWLSGVQVKPASGKPKNGKEAAEARVGSELYKLLFEGYTWKQWNKYPEQLDASVLERIPVRTDDDDRYFTDQHQALPSRGYTEIFRNMLKHPKVDVRLNVDLKLKSVPKLPKPSGLKCKM